MTMPTEHDETPAAAAGSLPIDRRALLGAGAGAALAGLSGLLPLAADEPDGVQPFRYVVADHRHPDSRAFGRALARQGAVPLDVAKGLTSLWQDRLQPLWRQPRGVVAGLTFHATWIGLAEQARGQFRKPRLIGIHSIDEESGLASHKVRLPPPFIPLAGDGLAGASWPAEVARLANRCASASDPRAREWCPGPPPGATSPAHLLVSWIIA